MSIKLQALSYFWPGMSIFSYAGWQVEFHLSTLRNMSYNNDGLWRPFRVIESSDWDNRLLNFIAGLGWQVTAFIPSHLVRKEIKHTSIWTTGKSPPGWRPTPIVYSIHRKKFENCGYKPITNSPADLEFLKRQQQHSSSVGLHRGELSKQFWMGYVCLWGPTSFSLQMSLLGCQLFMLYNKLSFN